MKKALFLSATLFLLALAGTTASAQSAPGPGWTRDQIKYWCDSSCIDCRDYHEVISSTDKHSGVITFMISCGCADTSCRVACSCNMNSTGVCTLYDERWPSVKDTASIIRYMDNTSACTKISSNEWKETLYGKNKKPLGCCVYWSLHSEAYRGAVLIGELRQPD